jgi:hypothetical protein
VYLHYKGPIPNGYSIHHIDGNPLNDHPNNLLAVPFRWNSDYLPSIAKPLELPESVVTQVYMRLVDTVPEQELYRTVIKDVIAL